MRNQCLFMAVVFAVTACGGHSSGLPPATSAPQQPAGQPIGPFQIAQKDGKTVAFVDANNKALVTLVNAGSGVVNATSDFHAGVTSVSIPADLKVGEAHSIGAEWTLTRVSPEKIEWSGDKGNTGSVTLAQDYASMTIDSALLSHTASYKPMTVQIRSAQSAEGHSQNPASCIGNGVGAYLAVTAFLVAMMVAVLVQTGCTLQNDMIALIADITIALFAMVSVAGKGCGSSSPVSSGGDSSNTPFIISGAPAPLGPSNIMTADDMGALFSGSNEVKKDFVASLGPPTDRPDYRSSTGFAIIGVVAARNGNHLTILVDNSSPQKTADELFAVRVPAVSNLPDQLDLTYTPSTFIYPTGESVDTIPLDSGIIAGGRMNGSSFEAQVILADPGDAATSSNIATLPNIPQSNMAKESVSFADNRHATAILPQYQQYDKVLSEKAPGYKPQFYIQLKSLDLGPCTLDPKLYTFFGDGYSASAEFGLQAASKDPHNMPFFIGKPSDATVTFAPVPGASAQPDTYPDGTFMHGYYNAGYGAKITLQFSVKCSPFNVINYI